MTSSCLNHANKKSFFNDIWSMKHIKTVPSIVFCVSPHWNGHQRFNAPYFPQLMCINDPEKQ